MIAVLGVLATVLIVIINPAQKLASARDAGRKSDLKQVANALEAYMVVHGSYPDTNMNWSWEESQEYEGPTGWIPDLAPGDIKKLPSDPRKGKPGSKHPNCATGPNGYGYRSNGTDYKIYAHCAPENYGENESSFIDPTRDSSQTWGGIGGNAWGWAVWSSDVSKYW